MKHFFTRMIITVGRDKNNRYIMLCCLDCILKRTVLLTLFMLACMFMYARNKQNVEDSVYITNCIKQIIKCTNCRQPSLKKEEKKTIETLLDEHKLMKNDTVNHCWRTLLDIAYSKGVLHDLKRAYKSAKGYEVKQPRYKLNQKSKLKLDLPVSPIAISNQLKQIKKDPQTKKYIEIKNDLLHLDSDTLSSDVANINLFIINLLNNIPAWIDEDTFSLLLSNIVPYENILYDFRNVINQQIENERLDLIDIIVKSYSHYHSIVRMNVAFWGWAKLSDYYEYKKGVDFFSSLISCPFNRESISKKIDGVFKDEFFEFLAISSIISTALRPNIVSLRSDEYRAIREAFGEDSQEVALLSYDVFLETEEARQNLKQKILQDLSDNDIDPLFSMYALRLCNSYYNAYEYRKIVEIAPMIEERLLDSDKYTFYNLWGLSESSIGLYESALFHYDKSLQYALNSKDYILNNKDKGVIVIYNKAYTLSEMGRQEEAIRLLNQNPPNVDLLGYKKAVYNDYYGLCYAINDTKTALKFFDEAHKSYGKFPIAYDNQYVRHLQMLSSLHIENKLLCKYYAEQAVDFANNKNDFSSKLFSKDGVVKGQANKVMGDFYASVFNQQEALRYYFLANKQLEVLDSADSHRQDLLYSISKTEFELGNYSQSSKHLLNLLSIQQQIYPNSHHRVLQSRTLLLQCYIGTREKEKAKQYFDLLNQNIGNVPKSLGADLLFAFSQYHYLYGNYNQSLDLLLNKMNHQYKEIPSTLLTKMSRHIINLADKQNYVSQTELITLAANMIKEKIVYDFSQLTNSNRENWAEPLSVINSDFIVYARNHKDVNSIALELSLFRKGLLFNTNSTMEKLWRKRNAIAYTTMLSLRDSLNNAISQSDFTLASALQDKIEKNEQELLSAVSSNYLKTKLYFNYKTISKNIGKNNIAIDIVRYEDNKKFYYGAFVFSDKLKSPEFIPLFDEASLTNLLNQVYTKNGHKYYQFYRDKAAKGASYNFFWSKLESYFEGYDNIYFSGDGLLNQLAIELLPDENDKPLNQKYRIHRVFHLADINGDSNIGNDFLAIGVSDYNTPVASETAIDRGSWTNLPNVSHEFQTIQNQITANAPDIHCKFVLDDMAREEYVKSLNGSSVSTLHFATHGFYRSSNDLMRAQENANDDDHNIAVKALKANQNSISGLILRTGNTSWKSPKNTADTDDILMSEEVENLDFPNLNLTVLSACETGLGDVDSDGVWGLQRAFRIAGSKSLLCSLCKVDDDYTALFMGVFYENASHGKTIYESYQAAQKFLFDETYTSEDGVSLWPSFILIE